MDSVSQGLTAYTKAEATVQTVFQGTTLRGLLLEAYGFSVFATIALWGAIAAFILAGLMAVLVAFGIIHARKTDEAQELAVHTHTVHRRGTGRLIPSTNRVVHLHPAHFCGPGGARWRCEVSQAAWHRSPGGCMLGRTLN